MKGLYVSILGLAAGSSASNLMQKRQGMLNLIPGFLLKDLPVANIDDSQKPEMPVSDAKRRVTLYGPFELPPNKDAAKGPKHEMQNMEGSSGLISGIMKNLANKGIAGVMSMDPDGFGIMGRLKTGFCENCAVLRGKIDVVFADGKHAGISEGVYLHHFIATDLTKRDPALIQPCPNKRQLSMLSTKSALVNVFIGGGVDSFQNYYTDTEGKLNAGYHLGENDYLLGQGELVNYKNVSQKVYVRADIDYVSRMDGADSSLSWLSSTGCDELMMSWKAGEEGPIGVKKSRPFPVNVDGTIVMARGHIHDGGMGVNLYINGNLACNSTAEYGGMDNVLKVGDKEWETITRMGECLNPIKVKKGDLVQVESPWDVHAHGTRESAGVEQEEMGIMYVVVVPDKNQTTSGDSQSSTMNMGNNEPDDGLAMLNPLNMLGPLNPLDAKSPINPFTLLSASGNAAMGALQGAIHGISGTFVGKRPAERKPDEAAMSM